MASKEQKLIDRILKTQTKVTREELEKLILEQEEDEAQGTLGVVLYGKGALEKLQSGIGGALSRGASYIQDGVRDTIARGEMRELRQGVETLAKLQRRESQTNEALLRLMKEKGVSQNDIDRMIDDINAEEKETSSAPGRKNPTDEL